MSENNIGRLVNEIIDVSENDDIFDTLILCVDLANLKAEAQLFLLGKTIRQAALLGKWKRVF